MPLGRKHLRRNRDAPNVGWTIQRTASNLSRTRREVNVPKELDALKGSREPALSDWPGWRYLRSQAVLHPQSQALIRGLLLWLAKNGPPDRDGRGKSVQRQVQSHALKELR